MNTYTWNITALDCYPQADGQTDVVFTAHWTANASSGATPPVTSSVYGTQSLTYDAKSAYTPYAQLTQDQVVGWVQSAMGIDAVTALQESLDKQIENQINPPVVTPPLPWAAE